MIRAKFNKYSSIDCNDNHYDLSNSCSKVAWVLDADDDDYYKAGTERQEDSNWNSSPFYKNGYKKKEEINGEDCDDTDATKTTDCSNKQKNCTKRTGFLHEDNFTNKKPILGDNIIIKTDNFRNDSWGIISDTDCGNG